MPDIAFLVSTAARKTTFFVDPVPFGGLYEISVSASNGLGSSEVALGVPALETFEFGVRHPLLRLSTTLPSL